MRAETELERANRGKVFWQQFCLAGWQLMGWTDDVTATFIDGAGRCLEMRPGHVELIRQARREALEEACKAQCADCEEGSPNFLVGPNYYHREGALTAKCEANLIRALMERED